MKNACFCPSSLAMLLLASSTFKAIGIDRTSAAQENGQQQDFLPDYD
jgi:hypothetical protein